MSGQRLFCQLVKLALATTVVLGISGCNRKMETHAESVNAANKRWLSARSGLLLQSAQRMFDTGDLTQCERTLGEALSMDPGNAKLHTLSGRVALERGQLERAYHRFQTAIELDEALPDPYFFRGIVLERWQRYEQALESYQKAYELQADNVAYLLSMAEMHVALDRAEVAKELLESRMAYFDQNAGIRVALAQLYTMSGDHERAARYLREASLLQPDDMSIVEELSLVLLASKRYDDAIMHLKRLCEAPAYRERVDLQHALASAYMHSGRLNEARERYLTITRLNREDVQAWAKLAEIAFANNDLSGALHAANRAIALAPDQHQGYLVAGMVWQRRGATEQALAMFDQAAQAAPQEALPHILRGLTFEQAGRRQEAIAAYNQALRIAPNDQRAQRLLANVTTQQ